VLPIAGEKAPNIKKHEKSRGMWGAKGERVSPETRVTKEDRIAEQRGVIVRLKAQEMLEGKSGRLGAP